MELGGLARRGEGPVRKALNQEGAVALDGAVNGVPLVAPRRKAGALNDLKNRLAIRNVLLFMRKPQDVLRFQCK